jgi:hypothetical protein
VIVMDKVKRFLEGYVEWIALALGAAFLMWMVYLYVFLQPVTVAVGPMPAVTPGSIDQQIWDGPGKTLETQIQKGQVARLTVPAFADEVAASFNTQPLPPSAPYTVYVSPPPDGMANNLPTPNDHQNNAAKVTGLPAAPPIVKLAVAAGHSNIMPPANAAAAAGGVPGGVAPVAAQAIDKSWVSVMGMLPSQTGLNPAFTAAHIPANPLIHKTTVLRVILVRQERDASGNWGPETVVPPPSIDALRPAPPDVATNREVLMAEQNYEVYAEQNPPLILRPPFYPVVQGDKWYTPGSPNPNESAVELVDDKFDAAHFTGDLDTLDDADRKAVMDARRQAAQAAAAAARQQQQAAAAAQQQAARQQQAAQRSAGRSGGGRSGGGRSGGASGGSDNGFLVADPARAAASASGLVEDDGQAPGVPPPPMPGAMPDTSDAANPAGGPVAPAGGDLPKGSFDPATQADFAVWAHDDTVVPGKTYRYKLRYVISNPVFATQQLCKPQTLALQFSIPSKDSDWTEPVNVESDTNFYAAALSHGAVQFDVFKWFNGVWQKQSVVASPGDVIGTAGPKPGDPNFATGWTLVDVREIPNETTNRVVLLASDNGTLQRELKIDSRNKKYRNLLNLVNKAAGIVPGQPGDAGPGQEPAGPGMPPGGPGV